MVVVRRSEGPLDTSATELLGRPQEFQHGQMTTKFVIPAGWGVRKHDDDTN